MAGIRGGKVTSIKQLEKSLKKSSGSGVIKYIPAEGIIVRFLTEPDEWIEWYEHFDEGKKASYPCTGDTCEGCATGVRSTKRFLSAAVDMNNGKQVIALQLPVTAAKAVKKKYDRWSTVMDRDYELSKEGSGLDTEYSVESEAPTKFDIRRYEVPDLLDILETIAGDNEDDEETDAPPARRAPARKGADPAKKVSRRPTIADEDDDDEDDLPPRRIVRKSATPPVKKALPVKKVPARKPLRRS